MRGWTLIETMIVVAILGILASIVVGAYQRAELRSRCAKGHYETTGRMSCTEYGNHRAICEPETEYVCDEFKAEED